MNEMMIYTIMGLLESGKTSLIKDLLEEELFDDGCKTLILLCEEGMEEYEEALLQKTNAVVELIEEEESFDIKVVKKFLKKHRPDRIVIEYNGMWKTEHIISVYHGLEDIFFDRPVIMQIIDVIDDTTFNVYIKNMAPFMVEHFKMAEMVIVNRCTLETKKNAIRGTIKAVNPRAQIVYESEDDAFYQMKEEMPFDVHAEIIEIEDDDFGLWHVDMVDHEEDYRGKTVKVTGMIQKIPKLEKGFVVFGRYAVTCCADDVQFLGFLCKGDDWDAFANQSYVTITARIEFKYMDAYGEEGPVFYAEEIKAAEKPKEELVYFN